MQIDAALAERLVAAQFPQWADLPIRPVEFDGWDNRTFRLGDELSIRMPSAASYAPQVDKEHRWLLELAPQLPLPIPVPVGLGAATDEFPWAWSVYRWLDGEIAARARIRDLGEFAHALAAFLVALRTADAVGGPPAGAHNFFRGGAISVYDDETRRAIGILGDRVDGAAATEVWDAALATTWTAAPVWVHGDISAGNLLVRDGRLGAVIDFGSSAVGDPACDLAITWTFFHGASREAFRGAVDLDAATWARGRGWTIWKSLIVAADLAGSNSADPVGQALRIIDNVIDDHRHFG